MRASYHTGYYLSQAHAELQLRCPSSLWGKVKKNEKGEERKRLKLTRHNGRSGKHGTYNPKHNDRRFDVAASEHIDEKKLQKISIGIAFMDFAPPPIRMSRIKLRKLFLRWKGFFISGSMMIL